MLSGGEDSIIRIWDIETKNELKKLVGHEDKVVFSNWVHQNKIKIK